MQQTFRAGKILRHYFQMHLMLVGSRYPLFTVGAVVHAGNVMLHL
jgi:hypothetical protein